MSRHERQSLLADQIFSQVQAEFPEVACVRDDERTSGQGYYNALCFHIHLVTPTGDLVELGDGGAVNWTQTLLSNAKERCVISGIGSERVCMEYVVMNDGITKP